MKKFYKYIPAFFGALIIVVLSIHSVMHIPDQKSFHSSSEGSSSSSYEESLSFSNENESVICDSSNMLASEKKFSDSIADPEIIEKHENSLTPLESKIYKDVVGALFNYLNNEEHEEIKEKVSKIASLKNNSQAELRNIYTSLIEILDKATLRICKPDFLSACKDYFDKIEVSTSSNAKPDFQKFEIMSDGSISPTSDNEIINTTWEKAKKILPMNLLAGIKYFAPFRVDRNLNHVVGFIQPLDHRFPPYDWILALSVEANPAKMPYILVHEYGHFISLKNSTLKYGGSPVKLRAENSPVLEEFCRDCLGYITTEFDLINKNNQYLFFARHKNDFVTMYSSTNLLEDFAETFARFVSDFPAKTERIRREYDFMNNHFGDIKTQIIENAKSHGITKILQTA